MKTNGNIAVFSPAASASMEPSCSGCGLAPGCSPLLQTLVKDPNSCKVKANRLNLEVCLEMGCEGDEADDVSSAVVEFVPDIKHSACDPISDLDFLALSKDYGELRTQNDLMLAGETNNALPNVRLICKNCGTGCLGLVELEQHAKLHKRPNGYGCQICNMQFTKSFQLLLHMTEHVQGLHVCSMCGRAFQTHSNLSEHAVEEHPTNGECGGVMFKENFKGAEEFHIKSSGDERKNADVSVLIAEHSTTRSCDDESVLTVDFCDATLVGNSEDVLTMPESCQSAVEVVPLVMPLSHSCLICNQVFTSHETLFNHCLSHPLIHIAGFGLPSCGICKTEFQNVVELHEHVQEKAGVLPIDRPDFAAENGSSGIDLPDGVILAALKNAINNKPQLLQGDCNDIYQSATGITFADGTADSGVKVECPQSEANTCSINTVHKEMSVKTIKTKKSAVADDASYVCSQCCRSFLNVQGLLCHMKMHAEGKPYKCNDCGDSFRFPKRLSIHARVFHDVILCIKCGLDEERCLCTAQKVDDRVATGNFKDSKKPFACLRCNRVFARVKALHKHELTHIHGIVHVCDICGKRFHDRSQFSRHLALHNGTQHQCQICQKVCSSDVILRDHMKTHSNERPLTCNICGKDFKWRNALRVHLKKHYGSTYQCYLCGRDFTTKSYLMTHVEMHTGPRVRSHKCSLCDKAYYDKSALRKHRATHAAVRSRPYACTLCGKTFLANNNLQTHIKLHQNERPYKCDVCGKSFNMKGHLKRHMTIHSKTVNVLQTDHQALLETEDFCQETCEEVVIDSVITLV